MCGHPETEFGYHVAARRNDFLPPHPTPVCLRSQRGSFINISIKNKKIVSTHHCTSTDFFQVQLGEQEMKRKEGKKKNKKKERNTWQGIMKTIINDHYSGYYLLIY